MERVTEKSTIAAFCVQWNKQIASIALNVILEMQKTQLQRTRPKGKYPQPLTIRPSNVHKIYAQNRKIGLRCKSCILKAILDVVASPTAVLTTNPVIQQYQVGIDGIGEQ
jgi:hypothetical protein